MPLDSSAYQPNWNCEQSEVAPIFRKNKLKHSAPQSKHNIHESRLAAGIRRSSAHWWADPSLDPLSNISERLISNSNQIPECSGPNSTRRLKYSNIQYIIASWLDEFSLNNPLNNLAIRAYNYSKIEHNSVLICTTKTTPILVLICIQHASLTTKHRP